MVRRWALIAGDFAREYGVDRDAMARMSVDEFMWRCTGLSAESRTLSAWRDEPKTLRDPDEIAAVVAAARR